MKHVFYLAFGFLLCFALPTHTNEQQAAAAIQQKFEAPPSANGESKKPNVGRVSECREALRKAEAEHPGNTIEVAEALDALVSSQIDASVIDAETQEEVNREVRVAEAATGARSKTYTEALGVQVEVLIALNRAAEARPIAERLSAIAQKEFPFTDDASTAYDDLGVVCYTLGDFGGALRAYQHSLEITRKISGNRSPDLISPLNNLGGLKFKMGDVKGAIAADKEALSIAYRANPQEEHLGVIENNLGAHYIRFQRLDLALEHLKRAIDLVGKAYGPNSSLDMQVHHNLGNVYTRMGKFPEAWKAYEYSIKNAYETLDSSAATHAMFALSLAQGGSPVRAVEESLQSARMSREMFVLQARTLPERQALAYNASRPRGLDTAVSVLLKHSNLPAEDVYQEVVRSRALVADEMARRQKNLNANHDPEIGTLLEDLNQARSELLATEHAPSRLLRDQDRVLAITTRMEAIERTLAQRSLSLRADERIQQATVEDVRRNLPSGSVLVSYFQYRCPVVDSVDPLGRSVLSYMAFVLHPESNTIRFFSLGEAASVDKLIFKARTTAIAESRSGGLGSIRNERDYREAGLTIRQRIWDPLKREIGDAALVLIVGDGNLNLVPFAGLPSGNGYLVEHSPVIHMLSSERDLVPGLQSPQRTGLFAIGSPTFSLARATRSPSPLRRASSACGNINQFEFDSLPGTAFEVADIDSTWHKWNALEPSHLVTGDSATLAAFLAGAIQNRVLHVATHAFLLNKGCGSGNPLLDSGLVFAGGGHGGTRSILTAQQIAALDLDGVDWAVLSACNTGNGELLDGEGVLGLQRAFRVAGAHSVIMTLWPVDDDAARQFMHELYNARLGDRATTASSVWRSLRKLLLQRRAAMKSTHPWYWAGFVGSGRWE